MSGRISDGDAGLTCRLRAPELEAVLVERQREETSELCAAWAHLAVGVDAVNPLHGLNEPEAAACAFALNVVLSSFDG